MWWWIRRREAQITPHLHSYPQLPYRPSPVPWTGCEKETDFTNTKRKKTNKQTSTLLYTGFVVVLLFVLAFPPFLFTSALFPLVAHMKQQPPSGIEDERPFEAAKCASSKTICVNPSLQTEKDIGETLHGEYLKRHGGMPSTIGGGTRGVDWWG